MEFGERVDERVESAIDCSVLVNGEEVERSVELGGLLLGERGLEVSGLFLVPELVLVSCLADFGELGRGLVLLKLLEVERV